MASAWSSGGEQGFGGTSLGPKGLGQKLALEMRRSFRGTEHQDRTPSKA